MWNVAVVGVESGRSASCTVSWSVPGRFGMMEMVRPCTCLSARVLSLRETRKSPEPWRILKGKEEGEEEG